jgi:hypothetical protein
MVRELSILSALGLLVACSKEPTSATVSQEGCYLRGFEANTFVPWRPKNTEDWWVTSVPESFTAQFDALASGKPFYAVSVKIRGVLSEPGHFGHLGGSSREVRILDFSDMRPMSEDKQCSVQDRDFLPIQPQRSE